MSPSKTTAPPLARVDEIMSTPVLTVEADATMWDAWQLLFVSGLRHLVVLDCGETTLGVISHRTVLAQIPTTPEHLQSRTVRDVIMRLPHLKVLPGDHPTRVAALMTEHTVEAVPVVDEAGRLLGIVSESDLVRWLLQ